MNTSIKIRAAAFVASILVTLTTVSLVANYAYPEAPAVRLTSAAN
jgi:hypothetical protein